jgi:hypothetical protein
MTKTTTTSSYAVCKEMLDDARAIIGSDQGSRIVRKPAGNVTADSLVRTVFHGA